MRQIDFSVPLLPLLLVSLSAACGDGGHHDEQPVDPTMSGDACVNDCSDRFDEVLQVIGDLEIDYAEAGGDSRAQESLGEDVDRVNDLLDEVFGVIGDAGSAAPETADDTRRVWRHPVNGGEIVLELSGAGATYDVAMSVVAVGDPPADSPAIFGYVFLDDHGDELNLFANLGELDYLSGLTGDVAVEGSPTDTGQKLTYKVFVDDGDELLGYDTSYWRMGPGEGVLQQVASVGGEGGEVWAHWAPSGGRYDAVVEGFEPEWGDLEIVYSECWDDGGDMTFSAGLQRTDDGDYGAVSGVESACEWGFSEAYPESPELLGEYLDERGWSAHEGLSPMPETPPGS